MNASDPGFNMSSLSPTQSSNMSTLTTALSPATPIYSDAHNPEVTIMVVLGLALLLAGLAAFLAACRPAEQGQDLEGARGPGGGLTRGRSSGPLSSEPQLKVWKRLGSYRRSYNISFRRPPYRRPQGREGGHSPARSPARQTLQPESGAEPRPTVTCLFDYVTEI